MYEMPDWFSLDYLKQGNQAQQEVFDLLQRYEILSGLKQFDPVLSGTLPIQVNVEGSDLDVICGVYDFRAFEEQLISRFGELPGFRISRKEVSGIPRLKANFLCGSWPVEIFGQPLPARSQNAYRHMQIEYRLLGLFGEGFREKVIHLKHQGYKTEPAFAKLLGLTGDPYQALLQLEGKSDEVLIELMK